MSDEIKTEDRPGQDVALDVLRLAAKTILSKPDRELTLEEAALFVKVSQQLAREFSEFDMRMCTGVFAPSEWKIDQGPAFDHDGIPTSEVLDMLKEQLEGRVMEYVGRLNKLGKKSGEKFTIALMEILKLSGQITAESIKIATIHRLKPSEASGGAHKLEVVRDTTDDTVTKEEA